MAQTDTEQRRVQAIIDRLAAARDTERLRAALIEDLDDEPFTQLGEWAESLTTVAEHVDTLKGALEEWRDAEGDREARADAKDAALEALGELLSAWDESPLDLARLTAYDPEAAL